MPEGHTIHRAAKDQTARLAGGPIVVSSPQGRFETDAALLQGMTLRRIEAWGKHLFYIFGKGVGPARRARTPGIVPRRGEIVVHVHLGLFGRFRHWKNPAPAPRGAVRIRLTSGLWTVDLSGPTDCRIVTPAQVAEICDRLGADPLRAADSVAVEKAWARVSKSNKTIGAMLLDQSVVSGVGNIYRAEVLFRVGLDPRTPGKRLTRAMFDAIWTDCVELLETGVKYNRIITVRADEAGKSMSKLKYRERTYVAHRQECLRCGAKVERFPLGGRAMFACQTCQPAVP